MSLHLKSFLRTHIEQKGFGSFPLSIFFLVFFLMLGALFLMTYSVLNSSSITILDQWFFHFLSSPRIPLLAEIFYVITNFADKITVIALATVSFFYLFFKKEFSYLYAFILVFLGTEASVYILKTLVNRSRPVVDFAYYIEKSYSFPSGHSAIALAFLGCVAYYLMHSTMKRSTKWIVIGAGSLLVLLIGFSRIYLGVHFLSDVLGGFLVGGLWLMVGIFFNNRPPRWTK